MTIFDNAKRSLFLNVAWSWGDLYLPKIHLCFCNKGDFHVWLGLLWLTIDLDYFTWGIENDSLRRDLFRKDQ